MEKKKEIGISVYGSIYACVSLRLSENEGSHIFLHVR